MLKILLSNVSFTLEIIKLQSTVCVISPSKGNYTGRGCKWMQGEIESLKKR